ncbi:MAG: GntR family transcriptional regulator [Clostridia bacterium]|nr:GntR family transcriptional regulator [Clostridia bacterium]
MQAKSTLQTEAYNYIKNLILSNKFDVDTLYSETKLSKEIGISRTPMREALQCLSQDGYITIYPSKGFMIRQLNQKDMRETIEIRCALEGFCTHVIASEINTQKAQRTINEMSKILELQKDTLEKNNDIDQFIDYDHQFHILLVNYINNEEANHIFQRLMYLIKLTSTSALEVEGRISGTLSEHTQYLDCLKKGDGNTAYKILVNHLMMPLDIVKTNK